MYNRLFYLSSSVVHSAFTKWSDQTIILMVHIYENGVQGASQSIYKENKNMELQDQKLRM